MIGDEIDESRPECPVCGNEMMRVGCGHECQVCKEKNQHLIQLLISLRRDHFFCAQDYDCSCPMGGDPHYLRQHPEITCNCGADAHNAIIDAELERLRGEGEA